MAEEHEPEKKQAELIERDKTFIEYVRFLTTLSTGSIVLLTSFLEGIEAQPKAGAWIGVAFIAFTICIMTCTLSYTMAVWTLGRRFASQMGRNVWAMTILITWLSFFIAIVALAVFGLANLY